MKQLTLFISIAFFAMTMNAQNSNSKERTKDELIAALAEEMCECALQKDVETLTENDLAMCMLPAIGKYAKDLERLNIELGNDAAMTALGEKIGLKAAMQCPQIFANFIEDEMDEVVEEVHEEEVIIYSGEVKKVEVKDFVTLYIKYDGQTKKIFWMSEVESNVDIYNGFKQLEGKRVQFTTYEATLFDPKVNEYRDFQILETLHFTE